MERALDPAVPRADGSPTAVAVPVAPGAWARTVSAFFRDLASVFLARWSASARAFRLALASALLAAFASALLAFLASLACLASLALLVVLASAFLALLAFSAFLVVLALAFLAFLPMGRSVGTAGSAACTVFDSLAACRSITPRAAARADSVWSSPLAVPLRWAGSLFESTLDLRALAPIVTPWANGRSSVPDRPTTAIPFPAGRGFTRRSRDSSRGRRGRSRTRLPGRRDRGGTRGPRARRAGRRRPRVTPSRARGRSRGGRRRTRRAR